MEKPVDFRYACGWYPYYRVILGIQAVKDEGWFVRNRAWAWVVLMTICNLIPQTACVQIIWYDLSMIIECLSTCLSMALAAVKISVLQTLGWIFDTMANDWSATKTKYDHHIMSEIAKITRFYSILTVCLVNALFGEYVISQAWSMVKNGRENHGPDPDLEFGFIMPSYFPFDISNPIVWVSLWIGQFFCTLLAVIAYSGPDCFASLAVLHLCGQLRIVRHSLKYLVDETTLREPQKYWRKLNRIVIRHEQLNHFASVITSTFSSILLVKMLSVTVIFCFQVYAMFTTVMDRDGAVPPILDVLFSVIYAIYTIVHLFAYCYAGDRLIVESSAISDDFYETAWYNLAPKEARAFLFVSHRTKTPLQMIAGGFCTFNMELFNAVLKNSMGYLSMLMAMKQRLVD